MKRFGGNNSSKASLGREFAIADHIFPAPPITNWDIVPPAYTMILFEASDLDTDALSYELTIPPFAEAELQKACARLSAGKAGGPSEVPNEALKALHFPQQWKSAKLVLLNKGGDKPVNSPSSFRSICLLNTPGKLLERLLLQRLENHLDKRGGIRRAPNQFGFRKGISTETAVECVLSIERWAMAVPGRDKELCALVTLDVKNAFNSLRWPIIDGALRKKATESRTVRPVTCGVPQGSVLGPTLWNVAYDDLLNLSVPPGVQLVGFANELAVVGRSKTSAELEGKINIALEAIDSWMASHGHELAHKKSEAVMLTRKRSYTRPVLRIGSHHTELKKEILYLGVRLDTKLTFVDHVRAAASKAMTSATALGRLMPNVTVLGQWKKRLLATVVESQLLYAASTWSDTVSSSARSVRLLVRPQRATALRVIRAYWTVSDEAQRWLHSSKGQCTRRLIRDVRKWVRRVFPRIPLSYHMTRALTGYGCFQYYLNRMGRVPSPLCVQCRSDVDTVDHTLLVCPYWEPFRMELSERLGSRPTVKTVSQTLLGPSEEDLVGQDHLTRGENMERAMESLRLFYRMVENILTLKEEEERAHQAAAAVGQNGPICRLNTVDKFFERLIKTRIKKRLEEAGDLDDRQYGFRKGRSTVDAIRRVFDVVEGAGSGQLYNRKLCAVVALDVSNAFNSARWPRIVKAMKDMPPYLVGIIESYLSDRTVVHGENSTPTTCGVPQGSVLGPLLWNMMYDELLQVDTGGNERGMSSTELVAFADDVAVVATGHTTWILETVINQALDIVAEWMIDAGSRIEVKESIRYLEVVLEVELEEDLFPDNIVRIMVEKRSNWDAVSRFVNLVQTTREHEERVRQRLRAQLA
ncbi:Uncharacterized protein FWK35_00024075 [Aphis craccivora]|uniref:Reverse transcriptase domain-containing protein n=1 Tax=Aphis craccivora TaxID=307492 RepID=A0A6G0WB31_APHCR|nr:Uncharacterized protein FWK35_00024075 [Aphis craccivora]